MSGTIQELRVFRIGRSRASPDVSMGRAAALPRRLLVGLVDHDSERDKLIHERELQGENVFVLVGGLPADPNESPVFGGHVPIERPEPFHEAAGRRRTVAALAVQLGELVCGRVLQVNFDGGPSLLYRSKSCGNRIVCSPLQVV